MKLKNGCTGSPLLYTFNYYTRLFTLLLLIVSLAGNRLSAQEQAQSGKITSGQAVPVKSLLSKIPEGGLKIGDKIPEEIWSLPLQVVNQPGGGKNMSLNDYQGKLIILDFWDTWCSNCIAAMPKLDSIQRHYKKDLFILAVTSGRKNQISQFWKNNNYLKNTLIPSAVEDTILQALFPHKMVPHVIWINEKGRVEGITSGRELSPATMKKRFAGNSLLLETKKDVLNYNPNKPLLINDNGGSQENFIYRSVLSHYISGLPSMAGIYEDSIRQTIVARGTNSSVISLYGLAFPMLRTLPEKRRIFKSVEPSRYYFSGNLKTKQLWNKENLYCYEVSLPRNNSGSIREFIREDLDRFFRVKSAIVQQRVLCLVLSRTKKRSTAETNGDGIFQTGKVFNDAAPDDVVFWMNSIKDIPVAINESGYSGKVSLSIDNASSIEDINGQLKKYGLEFLKEERDIDYFQLASDSI